MDPRQDHSGMTENNNRVIPACFRRESTKEIVIWPATQLENFSQ